MSEGFKVYLNTDDTRHRFYCCACRELQWHSTVRPEDDQYDIPCRNCGDTLYMKHLCDQRECVENYHKGRVFVPRPNGTGYWRPWQGDPTVQPDFVIACDGAVTEAVPR